MSKEVFRVIEILSKLPKITLFSVIGRVLRNPEVEKEFQKVLKESGYE
jgi:hypothetical protein